MLVSAVADWAAVAVVAIDCSVIGLFVSTFSGSLLEFPSFDAILITMLSLPLLLLPL